MERNEGITWNKKRKKEEKRKAAGGHIMIISSSDCNSADLLRADYVIQYQCV